MSRTVAQVAAAALAAALVLAPGTARASARTTTLVSSGATSGAAATFGAVPGASATQVLFTTTGALLAADIDASNDVYLNDGGTLSLMTPGTTGLVTFHAVSSSGTAIVISTTQSMVGGDTDSASDIYRVVGGVYTLLSGGSANTTPTFRAASTDASRVVFETSEALGGDSNLVADVYASTTGTPVLLTGGGVTSLAATYADGSADLSTVVFTSQSSLTGGDDVALESDVYSVPGTGGALTLVTDGTGGADLFSDLTPNGAKVFWSSEDDHAGLGDTDGVSDIYAFSGGTSTLVSAGDQQVTYGGSSADGSITYYATNDDVDPTDAGGTSDVYRFKDSDDSQTLMTGAASSIYNANFRDTSADGSRIVFETKEAIPSTGDADTGIDLYRSTGPGVGDKTLLSGAGATDVSWVLDGASDDGAVVAFTSTDALTGADTDTAQDVYVNEAGAIQLVSPGTASDKPATFAGRSPDESRVFFTTVEQLTAGDSDGGVDLYQSAIGTVAPPSPPPPDTTAPTATVTGKAEQKNNGKVKVTVTCGAAEACRLAATGSLKTEGKAYALKGAWANVGANGKTTLTLKVSKKGKKAAAAALESGKKVKGTVNVVVSDTAGNDRMLRFKVKLKA